jgi:hypothetical protein
MSSTTFVDGATTILASWLNDVNLSTYTTVPTLNTNLTALTTTVAGKAASGVNTDITSLNSPAIANATATTQTPGDNSTKVATTAFVTTATGAGSFVTLTGNQTIAGVKTFSSAPIFATTPGITAAQSMVRVNTANGYGSTNTKVRRFNTVLTSQGSDITYADSATLGASFTINTNGVYSITYTESFASGELFGITNATGSGSTAIVGLGLSSIENMVAHTVASYPLVSCITAYYPAGTVLKAHTNTSPAVGTYQPQLTIVRVA